MKKFKAYKSIKRPNKIRRKCLGWINWEFTNWATLSSRNIKWRQLFGVSPKWFTCTFGWCWTSRGQTYCFSERWLSRPLPSWCSRTFGQLFSKCMDTTTRPDIVAFNISGFDIALCLCLHSQFGIWCYERENMACYNNYWNLQMMSGML